MLSGGEAQNRAASADMCRLEVLAVSVQFDGLRALDAVSLRLAQQEILGLLGPNGAGKTTLANVMSGYQKPSHGNLFLNDEIVSGLKPEALARLGVARTFQSVRLFRRLTVLENVEAAALTRHSRRTRAQTAAREALRYIGLEAVAHRRADALPYADERRVGIARALALEPRFLLLDEPAAGMTEPECADLARLIQHLPEKFGCGVLLIEHNISFVMAVCSALHVLNNGRTLAAGPTEQVRRDPEVIAAYLGEA
jgi:branched-chain amino acid transport system ATP-binding protein